MTNESLALYVFFFFPQDLPIYVADCLWSWLRQRNCAEHVSYQEGNGEDEGGLNLREADIRW